MLLIYILIYINNILWGDRNQTWVIHVKDCVLLRPSSSPRRHCQVAVSNTNQDWQECTAGGYLLYMLPTKINSLHHIRSLEHHPE